MPNDSAVAPGRRARVDADRSVVYAEYGDPEGRPLLLFHGTPGSRALGELFDDVARRRGVRVVAPDRPGFGRSPAWPARSLTDTDEFVAPVLDDAGVDSAAAVGFSGGAAHALALAATAPDLVDGVDVVAAATPPSLREGTPLSQRLLARSARSAPWLLRALTWAQVRVAERASPSFVLAQYTDAEGRREVPDADADAVRRDFLAALSTRRDGLVRELRLLDDPWGFSPSAVSAPVRLWHGAADANAPAAAASRLAARLPDCETTVYDDADHLTALLRSREAVVDRHAPSVE
jgi:pimeloyl-ACP methyl ester carboxylesterase